MPISSAFTGIKFLGATVRGWNSNVGWNQQVSQMSIELVEDTANGDLFSPPGLGTPVYFQFGAFYFAGLIQKYQKNQSVQAFPTYRVIIVDPRELLADCQVVIGAYNGATNYVSNLINVYGYAESFGFGGSFANDSGMPWAIIKNNVQTLTAGIPSAYGGPIRFAGYNYAVDLSGLPIPPIQYRIGGGPAISLLELIDQVCQDGGHDYYVELVGGVITVRCVSRILQPPLGTITALVNQNTGNVISSENGLETRNETTSSFLVGGSQTTLFQTDNSNVQSFWGYDALGNLISPYLANRNDGFGIQVTVDLNASPIADVIGGLVYSCNTVEMRLALTNYESWATYLTTKLPNLAGAIGLLGPLDGAIKQFLNLNKAGKIVPGSGLTPNPLKPEMMDFTQLKAARLGLVAAGARADQAVSSQRVYEFVRNYAKDYYGKKYLVGIPFTFVKQDPQTLLVSTSLEPTDGGWLPDGSTPLGLAGLSIDTFTLQDGRYTAFVAFTNILGSDLSSVSPQDSAIFNGALYLKVSVDPNIVFTPSPAVVVTLNSPLYQTPLDIWGGLGNINILLNGVTNAKQREAFGTLNIVMHPQVIDPTAYAIPLKSNVSTYGPWYAAGAPGKVVFQYDNSLVPWNYGTYAAMNAAGFAKVTNAITNMQVSEAGSLELAGAPSASLGQLLLTGGPNVTNISVQYGVQGITTAYRFETYTQKYGVFSKNNAERVRQMGLNVQTVNKAAREGLRQEMILEDTIQRAEYGFFKRGPKALKRDSPHDIIVSQVQQDNSNGVRVGISTMSVDEAVTMIGAYDDNLYSNTAASSWNALLRPFTTQIASTGQMSSFQQPDLSFSGGGITSVGYNVYGVPNDIEYYLWGGTYNDTLHNYRVGADPTNSRGIALRGPLVLSGWGYGIDGLAYPPASGNPIVLPPDFSFRSASWPTGPVDLLWDPWRAVWTCHDIIYGALNQPISPNGSGSMSIYGDINMPSVARLWIWNPWSTTVASGVKVAASYVATADKWFLTTADCVGN